jgi:hypothetical protein
MKNTTTKREVKTTEAGANTAPAATKEEVMNKNTNLNEAFEAVKKAPQLGSLVWWTVTDTVITHDDLKALFAKHDIPEDALIATRARSAFKKALKEAEKDKLVRRIKDDADVIVYGVVEENADEVALDLDYTTTGVVIYNKETKTLTFKVTPEREADIRLAFEKYMTGYTSREVREIVKKYISEFCDGFLARGNGGVYFVPENKTSDLLKVEKAVAEINGGSHVFIMGVPDMDRERANALRLWTEEANREVEEMTKDIEKLVTAKSTRKGTLEARIESFKALKKKADAYASALGFEADALNDKVKALEEKVLAALVG